MYHEPFSAEQKKRIAGFGPGDTVVFAEQPDEIQNVSWNIGGNLGGVLMFLADFTGWYVQEREEEEWSHREIAIRDNTDTRLLNKAMMR